MEEESLRLEDECQKEEEQKELEKKQLKINDFNDDKMVGDFIMPCPSQFALGKLKSFSLQNFGTSLKKGALKPRNSAGPYWKMLMVSHKLMT